MFLLPTGLNKLISFLILFFEVSLELFKFFLSNLFIWEGERERMNIPFSGSLPKCLQGLSRTKARIQKPNPLLPPTVCVESGARYGNQVHLDVDGGILTTRPQTHPSPFLFFHFIKSSW